MATELGDLTAFVSVARAGGFREAARAGGSASGFSDAVSRLEARLGVRLLNRTTRSVTPTEAGARLLDRLGPALGEVEAVDHFGDLAELLIAAFGCGGIGRIGAAGPVLEVRFLDRFRNRSRGQAFRFREVTKAPYRRPDEGEQHDYFDHEATPSHAAMKLIRKARHASTGG